jgi:hypothetical protein
MVVEVCDFYVKQDKMGGDVIIGWMRSGQVRDG